MKKPPVDKRLTRATAIAKAANEEIAEIKAAQNIAENGPHLGKHFKQYDGDSRRATYATVTRMDENGWLYFTLFERDKSGNCRIYVDHLHYYTQHWARISDAEYTRARKAFFRHANKTI